MQLKARAPGSLMLLGEHAVLFGKSALVCAVNQFITVTLTPSPLPSQLHQHDDTIEIDAGIYGGLKTSLANLEIQKPFQFVLTAIKTLQPKLKRGFKLEITTDFSDQMGFGSSAAVTVATLAAAATWLDLQMTPTTLIRLGRQVVRTVQGTGSGADIAAAVCGGIVAYTPQPINAEKMNYTHPLSILYSGYKTKTPQVIQHVQNHFSAHPEIFRHLINSIGECANRGAYFARKKEWQKLGEVFNIQQGLMEALNVSDMRLRHLITTLRKDKNILGAKISGSGLGDCVVGLGKAKAGTVDSYNQEQLLKVAMTLQGVTCEKI